MRRVRERVFEIGISGRAFFRATQETKQDMEQEPDTETDRGEDMLALRDVTRADLPLFFAFQQDADANYMAAFTAKDPADWNAFLAHWNRILDDAAIINQTILYHGKVIGHVASFEQMGQREVTYWLDRATGARGWQHRRWRSFCAISLCVPSLRGRSKTMWLRCAYWRNAGS